MTRDRIKFKRISLKPKIIVSYSKVDVLLSTKFRGERYAAEVFAGLALLKFDSVENYKETCQKQKIKQGVHYYDDDASTSTIEKTRL